MPTERINSKKGNCNKVKQALTRLDILSEPFNFYLPDGYSQYKTTTGGVTLLIFSTLFIALIVA